MVLLQKDKEEIGSPCLFPSKQPLPHIDYALCKSGKKINYNRFNQGRKFEREIHSLSLKNTKFTLFKFLWIKIYL
jgi:hypothetical protein